MGENGYSLADIGALMSNKKDGFLEGNGIVILILFFLIFGFGGNGFGGQSANATTRDVYTTSYDTSLYNKLDSVSGAINSGFNGVQNQLCSGFNATNTNLLQGFNSANVLALQNASQISSAIDNNRFASQQCCCEVKTAIANQDAQNFRNTCDITNTIREEANKTNAILIAQQVTDLESKLADRDRELQTARFQLSQQEQTNALIQALRPSPIPAYATCSPYMSNYYAVNGCGCTGNV